MDCIRGGWPIIVIPLDHNYCLALVFFSEKVNIGFKIQSIRLYPAWFNSKLWILTSPKLRKIWYHIPKWTLSLKSVKNNVLVRKNATIATNYRVFVCRMYWIQQIPLQCIRISHITRVDILFSKLIRIIVPKKNSKNDSMEFLSDERS